MPVDADSQNLRTGQYRNAQNLNARVALHLKFSQNPYGWCRWVFDRLTLPDGSNLLELGCGPGGLWRENCDRIPAGWQVTLSDFSPGMLADCRENLLECPHPFAFEVVDAQEIPTSDNVLDAVIANHMLYHVPNRRKAFAEIRRVLKPGGLLFASTVGESHLCELDDLVRRGLPDQNLDKILFMIDFSLENGAQQLAAWFEDIRLERYPDSLIVTETAPLVAYVFSGSRAPSTPDLRAGFEKFVDSELQRNGSIQIHKDSGMFTARKPVST
jgi:ubiquinone/menaquinone biosynthesis C-methylase UbiE